MALTPNEAYAAKQPFVDKETLEHIVEQLAGRADKRLAETVLLLAGAFADEQNLGVNIADAEHDIAPLFAQCAAPAFHARGTERIPIVHAYTSGLG